MASTSSSPENQDVDLAVSFLPSSVYYNDPQAFGNSLVLSVSRSNNDSHSPHDNGEKEDKGKLGSGPTTGSNRTQTPTLRLKHRVGELPGSFVFGLVNNGSDDRDLVVGNGATGRHDSNGNSGGGGVGAGAAAGGSSAGSSSSSSTTSLPRFAILEALRNHPDVEHVQFLEKRQRVGKR